MAQQYHNYVGGERVGGSGGEWAEIWEDIGPRIQSVLDTPISRRQLARRARPSPNGPG